MTRLFEEKYEKAERDLLARMEAAGDVALTLAQAGREKFDQAVVESLMTSVSGAKFDAGKPRMELISPIAMEELAKVLAHGAKKYADRNWEKGLAWSRIIGSLLRHLFAYMRGERVDPESGCSHLAHVLCNAHFLVHYEKMRPEFDDLPKL